MLNAYVLDPMTIVRMRVHETCVLIVTNPEANAAKNQNGLLSVFTGPSDFEHVLVRY